MTTLDLQRLGRHEGRLSSCKRRGLGTLIAVLCGISLVCRHAHAGEKLREVGNLDGLHVALGPLAAASYAEGDWDVAVGAEVALFRVSEERPLAALGGSLGAQWFSERPGGRGWVQLEAATRLAGVAIGAAVGPSLELSSNEHARFGAQGTLWIFAGPLPYLRGGASQESGAFVELGVRIALPALRF